MRIRKINLESSEKYRPVAHNVTTTTPVYIPVEGAPSAFGNPAIGLELKPREILRVPSPRVARSLLTQQCVRHGQ